MDLSNEVAMLRAELRNSMGELSRYRRLYEDAIKHARFMECEAENDVAHLRAELAQLGLRHRVHKLLSEHYAKSPRSIAWGTFIMHRDLVAQHLRYQAAKGVDIRSITAADVAHLLQACMR